MPFEGTDNENSGIVYVWIGNKAAAEESKLIQEIAEDMFNNPWVSLQVSYIITVDGNNDFDEIAFSSDRF